MSALLITYKDCVGEEKYMSVIELEDGFAQLGEAEEAKDIREAPSMIARDDPQNIPFRNPSIAVRRQ